MEKRKWEKPKIKDLELGETAANCSGDGSTASPDCLGNGQNAAGGTCKNLGLTAATQFNNNDSIRGGANGVVGESLFSNSFDS